MTRARQGSKIDGKKADRIAAAIRDTTMRLPDIAEAEGLSLHTVRKIAEFHKVTSRGRM